MRVLMLSKACVVGAYQRKLEEIGRHDDVELTVVVPPAWHEAGRTIELEREHVDGYELVVESMALNGRFHLHFYPGLGRRIRQVQPDIIHIDEEPYNLATFQVMWLAQRTGAKTLFFTWQNIHRRYPPPFSWIEQYVLCHADAAIAGNQEAADVVRTKGYAGPVEVIPQFGVDPEMYKPTSNLQPPISNLQSPTSNLQPPISNPQSPISNPQPPFSIGYVGRLVREKGVDLLLEAVAGLPDEWQLRILGAGPLQASLQQDARRLGLGNRVIFDSARPSCQVPAYLDQLDVLVLPSRTQPNWKEQFGRVLIEAMACQVPVIGSTCGEIPNVIGDAGLLFLENDADALRRQLNQLMHDSDLRCRLGQAGRARVLKHFTQAQIARRTVALYRKLEKGAGRGEDGKGKGEKGKREKGGKGEGKGEDGKGEGKGEDGKGKMEDGKEKGERGKGKMESNLQPPISNLQSPISNLQSPTSVHIAINAHLLSLSDSYRGAGIHRYIRALLEYLPQVSRHCFTAYLGDPRAGNVRWPDIDAQLAPFSTVSPPARVFWEQLLQPVCLRRGDVDLLHGPAYALPLVCPTRSVVTVHDLSFFLYPETFNRANRLYLQLMTRLAAQRADAVIAVSEHTRQDVIRLLDVPANHVCVVPNGIDPDFHPLPAAELQPFREQRQLPDRFILCVSTIEPRKNLTTLIRAYAALGDVGYTLVIGGGRGWQYERVFTLVEELGMEDRVWFPGFIRHEELPYWYNAADVFVFPSIYEGFGLPPLEAMACGTPVIASNASSLPEVVGTAGQLVEPTDVDALTGAIQRVLTDEELATSMAERGVSRAAKFSWQASAERTVAVYESILEARTPEGKGEAGVASR